MIQPTCQVLTVVAAQDVPLVDVQMVTGWPVLTAWLRASCMSPSKEFTSPEIRFDAVMYLKVGVPTAVRMPTIMTTMMSSSIVNPAWRFFGVIPFMGTDARRANLLEPDAAADG